MDFKWNFADWILFCGLVMIIGITQLFMSFPIISLALSGIGLGYLINKWKQGFQPSVGVGAKKKSGELKDE